MSRIKLYNNLTQYQNAISTLPGLHVAFDGNNVYYSYAVTQAIKTSPRTSLNLHVQEHSTYISRYPSLAQPWVVFDGEHVHYSGVVEVIHYTLTLNFSGAHITINGITYQNQYIGTYAKDQTITIPDVISNNSGSNFFSGWYFDSNLTQEAVNINANHRHQMTDNLTLYAKLVHF